MFFTNHGKAFCLTPGAKDHGSDVDQTLCYAFGTIMGIRRTVLRLVGFPDEYRRQKKNAEIKNLL